MAPTAGPNVSSPTKRCQCASGRSVTLPRGPIASKRRLCRPLGRWALPVKHEVQIEELPLGVKPSNGVATPDSTVVLMGHVEHEVLAGVESESGQGSLSPGAHPQAPKARREIHDLGDLQDVEADSEPQCQCRRTGAARNRRSWTGRSPDALLAGGVLGRARIESGHRLQRNGVSPGASPVLPRAQRPYRPLRHVRAVAARAGRENGASDVVVSLVDFGQLVLEPLEDCATHTQLPKREEVATRMAGAFLAAGQRPPVRSTLMIVSRATGTSS